LRESTRPERERILKGEEALTLVTCTRPSRRRGEDLACGVSRRALGHPQGVEGVDLGQVPEAIESTSTGIGTTGAPEESRSAAEPRWLMAIAVLAATIRYVAVPHRGRIPGWWLFPVLQLVLLGLLIGPAGTTTRRQSGAQPRWGSLAKAWNR